MTTKTKIQESIGVPGGGGVPCGCGGFGFANKHVLCKNKNTKIVKILFGALFIAGKSIKKNQPLKQLQYFIDKTM